MPKGKRQGITSLQNFQFILLRAAELLCKHGGSQVARIVLEIDTYPSLPDRNTQFFVRFTVRTNVLGQCLLAFPCLVPGAQVIYLQSRSLKADRS